MTAALANRTSTTAGLGSNTLDRGSLTYDSLPDDKEFSTDVVVVLGIGNGTLQCFGNQGSSFFGTEAELLQSINGGKALYLAGDLTGLESGNTRVSVGGYDLHG